MIAPSAAVPGRVAGSSSGSPSSVGPADGILAANGSIGLSCYLSGCITRESALSRAARLLNLIQALRRRRRAVPAALLAAELGVSLRTIYRDIET